MHKGQKILAVNVTAPYKAQINHEASARQNKMWLYRGTKHASAYRRGGISEIHHQVNTMTCVCEVFVDTYIYVRVHRNWSMVAILANTVAVRRTRCEKHLISFPLVSFPKQCKCIS